MEMTNNITNHICGVNDMNSFLNGESPIKLLARGIQALQQDQKWTAESKAREQAKLIWRESADFKTLLDLRTKQRELNKDESKTFWTKEYRNAKEREAAQDAVVEIFDRNVPFHWYISTQANNAMETIEYAVMNEAASSVADTRLPESTIYAILLTIPELENKSFDDILKIVNKYVTK